MDIGVIGVGYVGAVTGTCFAYMGHKVSCYDVDEGKIGTLKDGKLPIHEPGLEHYLTHSETQKNLTFTTNIKDLVAESELIFICIGTPSKDNGDVDMSYVDGCLSELIPLMKDGQCLVFKSTVPIGTARKARERVQALNGRDIQVISNPEFLKEGTAINDFMKPERIIVGVTDQRAEALMRKVYEPLTRNGHPILVMDNQSAEMAKYACNTMLAARISLTNEIANLCEVFGANVQHVRQAMASDSRIGPKFLYPSLGYGGSCFPKDVKGLMYQARERDFPLRMIAAAEEVNSFQKQVLFKKFSSWRGNKKITKVAVWGTAFKPETDDIRESGALVLIRTLLDSGINVYAHDPVASANTATYFKGEKNLTVTSSDHVGSLAGASALFICTEWQVYQNTPLEKIAKGLDTSAAIFDGRNIFTKSAAQELDLSYFGIGQ